MTFPLRCKRAFRRKCCSLLWCSSRLKVRHSTTMLFLLLMIVGTTAQSSCSNLKNQNSREQRVIVTSPDFCDLVRRPDSYDSKNVRLRSILTGFHEPAFYGSCDGQTRYIRADFDSKSRNQLVQRVSSLGDQGMKSGNFWVDVVASGRFEKIPDSDCKSLVKESGIPNRYYPNYCYRIAIENVERVDPVPTAVTRPQ